MLFKVVWQYSARYGKIRHIMVIPPKYSITSEMLDLLSAIQAINLYFLSRNLPKQLRANLQGMSLLKSSIFSARIEGNPLEIANFQAGEDEKKLEVFNIINAIKLIDKVENKEISKDFILELHKQVLKKLSIDAGNFRNEPSAIFNSAGVAIYISPSSKKIQKFLSELLNYINSDSEKFPLITAFIAHLIFEKIHPFIDGNGRVGRLLIETVLRVKNWNLELNIPFEEYLDEHKANYYHFLDIGFKETNNYLVFMLQAYLHELEKLKNQIETESVENKIFLPPRQNEVFNLIKDYNIVSLNMIHRRFLKVPERTLRYDLNKLVEKGLIEKTGETKGRYYRLKKM